MKECMQKYNIYFFWVMEMQNNLTLFSLIDLTFTLNIVLSL